MNSARTFVENRITSLRRVTQGLIIIALVGLLLSGQVGVDVEAQSIDLFGSRIWPHEMPLILLGLAVPMALLAGFATVFGRAFCGWACPQTTLCELANFVQGLVIDNWSRGLARRLAVLIGSVILALGVAAMAGALLVGFFVSPQTLVRMAGGEFTTSLLKGLTVATFLVLVDVALLRHTFCEWICVVGWWQRLFAGDRSLRIAFATGRAKECTNCNGCSAVCFMRINPRRRNLPKTCLNCGKCVAACKKEMASAPAVGLVLPSSSYQMREGPVLPSSKYQIREGLIAYSLGSTAGANGSRGKGARAIAFARAVGAVVLIVATTGLLAWFGSSRDPVQVKVRQVKRFAIELVDGEAEGAYTIDVYNTGKSDMLLEIKQTGLLSATVTIDPNPIAVPPHGRASAGLTFHADPRSLHPGRNVFQVTAADVSGSGRKGSERVVFGLPVLPPVSERDSATGTQTGSDTEAHQPQRAQRQ